MSLGCGNCRRFDFDGAYFMLYLLEKEGEKLDFIDRETHISPNCCLCPRCVGDARELGRTTTDGLESGYALVAAASGGQPQWSDIRTDASSALYFDDASAAARWPKALEILAPMARAAPEPASAEFVERLFRYLRRGGLRFRGMAELGPNAIAGHDTHGGGRGEIDVYFDLATWTPKHPEVWGDTLATPESKAAGIGILPCLGYGRRPETFKEFLALAPQTLVSLKEGTAWYDAPRAFRTPADLLG